MVLSFLPKNKEPYFIDRLLEDCREGLVVMIQIMTANHFFNKDKKYLEPSIYVVNAILAFGTDKHIE